MATSTPTLAFPFAPPGAPNDMPLIRRCASAWLVVFTGVLVTTAAIHVRATMSTLSPSFLGVWLWQAGAWLPWFVVVPALAHAVRTGQLWGQRIGLGQHVTASVLVTALSTAWFWSLSSQVSPFLGAPDTRFGVFKWFFVFWGFASFLGYWAVAGFVAVAGSSDAAAPSVPAAPEVASHEPRSASQAAQLPGRLLLESGGAVHVVLTADVDWIEAQDYYAVVHAGDRAIWVKRSLDDLGVELDPARFVRIHRSTVVNLDRIERIEKDESGQPTAVLHGGVRRRFSQTRWQQFRRDSRRE
jgi:hypothetical protein